MSTPKYWFKRRRYGYGWTPSVWQGWASLIVLLGIIIGGAIVLLNMPESFASAMFYLGAAIILIILFVVLVVKKGPAPKWRWGKKSDDDPGADF